MQKQNNSDLIAQVFKNPSLFIACGFGVGLIRPGPGTWGTLIALPIHYALISLLALEALLFFLGFNVFFGYCRL